MVVSRRVAWVLVALCGWTLFVWINRLVNMAGEDRGVGFFVVHAFLAVVSIAFGLVAGWVGVRALRAGRTSGG